MAKLDRVLAVFYESSRLYPAVRAFLGQALSLELWASAIKHSHCVIYHQNPLVSKLAQEDVKLVVNAALTNNEAADPDEADKKSRQRTIAVPKGSILNIDISALHYNRK